MRPLPAPAVSCLFCVHALSGLRVLCHYSHPEASYALTENVKSRKLDLQNVLCIPPQILPMEAEVHSHQGASFFEDAHFLYFSCIGSEE